MTEDRRSRLGWKTTPVPAETVARRLTPIVMAYVCIVLLAITVGALVAYIVDRSNYRDAEQERVKQQIEQEIVKNDCALMDRLPAGGPLDPLRTYYHCGPGLPTTQETP